MLTVELQHKKHNFGQLVVPMGAKLTFSEQSVIVEAVELDSGDSEEGKEPTAVDKVRRALGHGPAYWEELTVLTGLAKRTVQNAITELKKRSEVEPTGERRGQAEQVRLVSSRPSTIRDRDRDATVEDQEASV